MYYIYTDHLNTPRAITDTSNNLQWTWENKEAFGNNAPTEVVTGFKFNFRLPGQYFDSEANLNYNIHRDYNPVWGRYMSSDPLGLGAGINTYGYVRGNSLGFSDRLGLLVEIWGFGPGHGGFGHLAIRVNERVFSFYPIDTNRDGQVSFSESFYGKGRYVNQSVSEFLYDQAGDVAYVFTLNLSQSQESLLNNNILNIQKQYKNYSLFPFYNSDQCTSFGAAAANKVQNKLNIPGWQPKATINYLLDETIKGNNMIKKFDYGIINMKYKGIQ